MRLAARAPLRIAAFVVLAAIVVWPALPFAAYLNEYRDAQVFALHEHAATLSVLRYHQLPLWDPYYCGGLYGLGAPQSRFASPAFLASLALGPERAEIVVVFLSLVVGMETTYRWLRLRVDDAWAAMRVAPIFALCGYFAVSFFRGWTSFFGFELVPIVLLGVTLAARGRVGGLAAASIAFAAILGFGGAYAAPLVALASVVEAVRALLELPRAARRRGLVMLGLCASFMLTVSAVRLLPLAETLAAAPRIMAGTPGHKPREILAFLVEMPRIADGDAANEGAFRVGWAFLFVAGLGGADRRSVRALIAALVFVWLAAGYARKPALFSLLRELPIFSALRYPERFLWIAILMLLEPAAKALTSVPRLGESRTFRRIAEASLNAAIAFVIVGQTTAFARMTEARTLGVLEPATASGFHQSRGNRWLAAHLLATGAGSLSCWETHPVRESSRLRGDLPAEEYLGDPTAGSVTRTRWSPNRIDVHVALDRPTRLFENQNWHPGWRASAGTVVNDDGLLAVDLPAGEHDLALSFRPRSAFAGAATTLAALAALALLALRARRGRWLLSPRYRGVTTAASLLPWLVLGVFGATWDEPRFPPPLVVNADGSPALVASPPADATRLDTTFELPISLVAARVSPPDLHRSVRIELWLRRTGPLPRETAAFVHVARRPPGEDLPEGRYDFFNLDHQVVGGSFYLSDAPAGELVHDSIGVNLNGAVSGDYEVLISFGHVSGRRGRTEIVRPGAAEVVDRQARIATFDYTAP